MVRYEYDKVCIDTFLKKQLQLFPETVAETSPELTKLVNDTTEKLRQEKTRKLSKYDYPDHIVTAAMMQKMARYGVHFRVRREECQHVRSLDAQRAMKKEIYGSGLLLSD